MENISFLFVINSTDKYHFLLEKMFSLFFRYFFGVFFRRIVVEKDRKILKKKTIEISKIHKQQFQLNK